MKIQMAFETNFRKKNKQIAASSVRTYLANIRRLARALGHDSIPEKGPWLKKAPAWLNNQNLNTKKILSAAGVKAAVEPIRSNVRLYIYEYFRTSCRILSLLKHFGGVSTSPRV